MEREEMARIVGRLIEDCDQNETGREAKRLRALEFFRGEMTAHLPSDPGRSSMVSKDVRATIRKVMPALKRVILGSSEIVKYEPVGPNDEPMAAQATKYVNKIVIPETRAEDAISDAILSAVLLDEGVLHWWHEEKQRIAVTWHSGLTEPEVAALQASEGVEMLEAEPYEADIQGQPMTLYRVRTKRVIVDRKVCVAAIPLEDFLMHPEARSEDDSPIIGHKMRARRSDLVAMGYDRQIVDDLPRAQRDLFDDDERMARNPDDYDTLTMGEGVEGAMEEVEIVRCFVRIDADDDGIAELREVHYVDGGGVDNDRTILFDDYADEANYAVLVTERIMHGWQGVSVFDDVEDLQMLKTALIRQTLDNLYASNNPQPVMQVGAVLNPDAVFSPEFGKPIQVRQGVSAREAIQWQNIPFFAEKTIGMLDRADATIADRTGITSAAAGLDPNALQNVREQGVQMISDAASAQAWCMVREIARGGLARMFRGVLKLIVQHQDKPRTIKLNDKWESFDPRSWNADMDCEVNTGLGTGSRERDMAALSLILSYQEKVIEGFGPNNPFVKPSQLGYTLQQLTEAAGMRSPDKYFSVPNEQEEKAMAEPKPSPDEMKAQMDAQIKIQVEQAKAEAARAKEEAQAQADIAVGQVDAQIKRIETEHKAAVDAMKNDDRLAFERLKHEDEMDFKNRQLAQQERLARMAKSDETPDVDPETGEAMPTDTHMMMANLTSLADQIRQLAAIMAAPKVGTLPDGRTITIQSQAA